MSQDSKHGTAKSPAKDWGELKCALEQAGSAELACATLVKALHVTRNEIALLRLQNGILRFIYPIQFHDAGAIPLSGSSVAARTAVTRTPLLSNSFARVKHTSLFESVRLRNGTSGEESDPMPIQKIISVPVIASEEKVVGVIQISRKGLDPSLAGADFTSEDLKLLERAAAVLAEQPFMQADAPVPQPSV